MPPSIVKIEASGSWQPFSLYLFLYKFTWKAFCRAGKDLKVFLGLSGERKGDSL